MTKLFTSVQFLNCNTRMCVTIKQRIKVLKKKKPHPDPDEIIMKLSPRIVLNKTQKPKEVPRWSSYITTFSTAVISRPITCKCLYNFMFHIQTHQ